MAVLTLEEASLKAGIRVNREAMRKASTPQGRRAAFWLLAGLRGRQWKRR